MNTDNETAARLAPLDASDPAGDLTRRLRVLFYARPLLQLRRNEAHRQQDRLTWWVLSADPRAGLPGTFKGRLTDPILKRG